MPQGSNLGPILLIIFINDIVNPCGPGVQLFFFADDAKMFIHVKDDRDCIILQSGLDEFVRWAEEWLVKINIEKYKVLTVRHKGTSVNVKRIYNIKNNNLEQVEIYKDLGVLIDEHLAFDKHISEKVNKAYSVLGIRKRNFRYVSKECYINLYKTMVWPHLEYANVIWKPRRISDMEKIEKVQRGSTKSICNNKNLSYEQRLRELKLPTLYCRQIRDDMIEVYKILNGKYDSNLKIKLQLYTENLVGMVTRGNGYKLLTHRAKYE